MNENLAKEQQNYNKNNNQSNNQKNQNEVQNVGGNLVKEQLDYRNRINSIKEQENQQAQQQDEDQNIKSINDRKNRLKKITSSKTGTYGQLAVYGSEAIGQTMGGMGVSPLLSTSKLGFYGMGHGKTSAEAGERRKHQEQTGKLGKADQAYRTASNLNRSLYSAGAGMGALTGVNAVPSLFSMAGMGLPSIIGTSVLGSLVGSKVNKSIRKIRASKKVSDEEQKSSLSDSLSGYYNYLYAQDKLDPQEQMYINLLMWIESHTSVIPNINSKVRESLEREKDKKEQSNFAHRKYDKVTYGKDTSESSGFTKVLNKLEDSVLTLTNKFDPFTQLSNFLLGGFKTPTQVMKEIQSYSTYGESKEQKEKYKSKEKQLGISKSSVRLLDTDSSQLTSYAQSFEERSLLLNMGQFDVLRLATQELMSIRKHAYGLDDNVFSLQSSGFSNTIFGKLKEGIDQTIQTIPGISALYNISKKIVTLPETLHNFVEGSKTKLSDLLFGKEFNKLRDTDEIDKQLGFKKSDQETSTEFLAGELPNTVSDILTTSQRQLEVQKNIYEVANNQYSLMGKTLANQDVSHQYKSDDIQRKVYVREFGQYIDENKLDDVFEGIQRKRETERAKNFGGVFGGTSNIRNIFRRKENKKDDVERMEDSKSSIFNKILNQSYTNQQKIEDYIEKQETVERNLKDSSDSDQFSHSDRERELEFKEDKRGKTLSKSKLATKKGLTGIGAAGSVLGSLAMAGTASTGLGIGVPIASLLLGKYLSTRQGMKSQREKDIFETQYGENLEDITKKGTELPKEKISEQVNFKTLYEDVRKKQESFKPEMQQTELGEDSINKLIGTSKVESNTSEKILDTLKKQYESNRFNTKTLIDHVSSIRSLLYSITNQLSQFVANFDPTPPTANALVSSADTNVDFSPSQNIINLKDINKESVPYDKPVVVGDTTSGERLSGYEEILYKGQVINKEQTKNIFDQYNIDSADELANYGFSAAAKGTDDDDEVKSTINKIFRGSKKVGQKVKDIFIKDESDEKIEKNIYKTNKGILSFLESLNNFLNKDIKDILNSKDKKTENGFTSDIDKVSKHQKQEQEEREEDKYQERQLSLLEKISDKTGHLKTKLADRADSLFGLIPGGGLLKALIPFITGGAAIFSALGTGGEVGSSAIAQLGQNIVKKMVSKITNIFSKNTDSIIGKALQKIGIQGLIRESFTSVTSSVAKIFTTHIPNIFSGIIKNFTGGAVESIAKSGSGILGKVLGKAGGFIGSMFKNSLKLFKKIPGIGAAIGLAFGINEIRKGDILGGLMEIGSGFATTIPVVGTGVSLLIDFLHMGKDALFGDGNEKKEDTKGIFAKITDFIKNTITGTLKGIVYNIPFFGGMIENFFEDDKKEKIIENKPKKQESIFTKIMNFVKDKVFGTLKKVAFGVPFFGGIIESFFNGDEEEKNIKKGEKQNNKSIFKRLSDFIKNKVFGTLKKVAFNVPFFGGMVESFFNGDEEEKNIEKGEKQNNKSIFKRLSDFIKNKVKDTAFNIPFVGGFIKKFFDGDEEEQKQKQSDNNEKELTKKMKTVEKHERLKELKDNMSDDAFKLLSGDPSNLQKLFERGLVKRTFWTGKIVTTDEGESSLSKNLIDVSKYKKIENESEKKQRLNELRGKMSDKAFSLLNGDPTKILDLKEKGYITYNYDLGRYVLTEDGKVKQSKQSNIITSSKNKVKDITEHGKEKAIDASNKVKSVTSSTISKGKNAIDNISDKSSEIATNVKNKTSDVITSSKNTAKNIVDKSKKEQSKSSQSSSQQDNNNYKFINADNLKQESYKGGVASYIFDNRDGILYRGNVPFNLEMETEYRTFLSNINNPDQQKRIKIIELVKDNHSDFIQKYFNNKLKTSENVINSDIEEVIKNSGSPPSKKNKSSSNDDEKVQTVKGEGKTRNNINNTIIKQKNVKDGVRAYIKEQEESLNNSIEGDVKILKEISKLREKEFTITAKEQISEKDFEKLSEIREKMKNLRKIFFSSSKNEDNNTFGNIFNSTKEAVTSTFSKGKTKVSNFSEDVLNGIQGIIPNMDFLSKANTSTLSKGKSTKSNFSESVLNGIQGIIPNMDFLSKANTSTLSKGKSTKSNFSESVLNGIRGIIPNMDFLSKALQEKINEVREKKFDREQYQIKNVSPFLNDMIDSAGKDNVYNEFPYQSNTQQPTQSQPQENQQPITVNQVSTPQQNTIEERKYHEGSETSLGDELDRLISSLFKKSIKSHESNLKDHIFNSEFSQKLY